MDSSSGPSQSPGPSQYQYEPLPDPRTHVRLIQIQQCHPDTTIQCKFTSWLLEDAPAYHAILYTWGDPKLTPNILINHKNMIVRSNCEYALQQAYATCPVAYVWIDTICINQQDSEEKGHQVGIMADFYRQAAGVPACVRPHSKYSRRLFRLLLKHENCLRKEHRKLQIYPANEETYGWAAQVYRLPTAPTFKFLVSRIKIVRIVADFLSRP
jgi:hypothetical protein